MTTTTIKIVINQKHIFIFCLLGLLSGSANLLAQKGAVATFDSGYVETGNPFLLHLSVPEQYGQPAEVDFTPWAAFFPEENILNRKGWQQQNGRWVNDFTLLCFDSAQLELPPLRLLFAGGDQIETNALSLNVLPTPAPDDPSAMLDIKDIYREPWSWRDYLIPLWPVFLAVLLLALAIWWLLIRNKKSGLRAERQIKQAPHELALRKLAELERQQLWQAGQLKNYYSQLTYIAREYLENRFKIAALESPTDGILRLLENSDVPERLQMALAELLQWADLAKFAKGNPPDSYHATAIKTVHQLIENTKPQEQTHEQTIDA